IISHSSSGAAGSTTASSTTSPRSYSATVSWLRTTTIRSTRTPCRCGSSRRDGLMFPARPEVHNWGICRARCNNREVFQLAQRVELNALVLEVLGILRRVFDTRIEFALQPGPQVPAIQGVPCHLTQILLNLCLNARDAMPRGGRLTVSTEQLTIMAVETPGG